MKRFVLLYDTIDLHGILDRTTGVPLGFVSDRRRSISFFEVMSNQPLSLCLSVASAFYYPALPWKTKEDYCTGNSTKGKISIPSATRTVASIRNSDVMAPPTVAWGMGASVAGS